MSDTPDTSNANVAKILRCAAVIAEREGPALPSPKMFGESLRALADALDRQASVPWSEQAYDIALDTFRVDGSFRAGIRAYLVAVSTLTPKEPTP